MKKRYTRSREKEEVDVQKCPCGTATEGRMLIFQNSDYQGGTGRAREGMRALNKGGMKSFDALDSSEKTVTILGDGWWQERARQDGR